MKKPEKLTFAINILESAWLLYFAGLSLFHGEEYIYWPAVVSIWCLVQHSSVKTQRHLLVCPFPRTPPDPAATRPSSTPSPPTTPPSEVPVLVLARMFTNVFIFFLCEKFRTLRPRPLHPCPFRSLCKVYITMVLFLYNTL